MGVIDRVRAFFADDGAVQRADPALSFADWLGYFGVMNYGGTGYPFISGTALGEKQEMPSHSFEGYVQGLYKTNGVIFACMAARLLLFSEARFAFRRRTNGRPGDLFGTKALDVLEHPWRNATTGDLLARAIQDVDLAGNHFAVLRQGAIRRLRPDWVTIVVGSQSTPNDPGWALDAEVIGYIYQPIGGGNDRPAEILLPDEVAHFAPIPDPAFRFRGMSWLTPVIREVMADSAATAHKLKFFENGATPSTVVSLDKSITKEAYDAFVTKMREQHEGVLNAYRTLYLGGGSTVQVVGQNMRQIDFKVTQGAGETRIAAAARIPPVIVGLSEGLAAATYSNYGQARRAFTDGTMRPLWRNIAGSYQHLIQVPAGAELWYDDRDIAFLKEDQKDAADIAFVEAQAIRQLVDAGFEPDSAIKAIEAKDLTLLKHTGLYSVQLQTPGSPKMPELPPVIPGEPKPTDVPAAGNKPGDTGNGTKAPAPTSGPAVPTPSTQGSPKRELSPRERDVAERCARNLTNKEIAEELGVAEKTVENHVAAILRKLQLEGRDDIADALGTAPRSVPAPA